MKKTTFNDSHFGKFGGMFVPDTLVPALDRLSQQYAIYKKDKLFKKELNDLLTTYVGRPTPLFFAKNISKLFGYKIYLKREDLNHTGAHKINNTIGQALLAIRMNKRRIIAETGAGQHGVATATVCALLGLECVVYMGTHDMARQSLNVERMKLLGATIVPVDHGSKTLKDATTEAIRDWLTNVETTHYIIGSAVGPHPYPTIVRDMQSVIGKESKKQILACEGQLPDAIIACVGGGSNSIGIFHPFIKDKHVKLIAVEAGGYGIDTDQHSASLAKGKPGVLHGSFSYLLQDSYGQIQLPHSISAGLDYPGVGPELSYLKESGRIQIEYATDYEAIEACHLLSKKEGIIPALESAHAIAALKKIKLKKNAIIIVNVSGRGDKDLETIIQYEL